MIKWLYPNQYMWNVYITGKRHTHRRRHILPNSDENIQFVLDLADKSVKIETLETLISSKTKKSTKKDKELKIQEGGILKFTKKEIQQMPSNYKNIFACEDKIITYRFHNGVQSLRVIDEKYLECETSKERMGRNIVLRRIPFTPVAKRVLPYIDFEKARTTNSHSISSTIKRLFPNHPPHELRYTFITRCKEAGVNLEIVMLWDGHSFDKDVKTSVVDRGYTDYSEEYVLTESEKVNYTF